MHQRIRDTYNEFPRNFRFLVVAAFIDRLGSTMIFPFFTLYVTQKLGVGMTEAGVLLAIFSISGFIGSMVGGALTDRFGRRSMLLFGLVSSALSSISMGLVNELRAFYALAVLVGSLSSVGAPARNAMVADMLPQEKHAEGYGVVRVAGNLAWIFGPTIGGLLAVKSYLPLFIFDAVSSLTTAAIVYRSIPETKPQAVLGGEQETVFQTISGYRHVATDRAFLGFILSSMAMTTVYVQMYSSLSVFLRDVHAVPARGFGLLLSLNAGAVVLFQFWVTRKTRRYAPLMMMALGSTFYLVGFTMYGFIAVYPLFIVAMILITIGEMIVIPVSQAIVARLAPKDKRGRYMAFFDLSWMVPSAIGPWAAGLIIDHSNPRWVWYGGGILCAIATGGFLALHAKTRGRFATGIDGREPAVAVP